MYNVHMLLEHERFSMFEHGCSNDHMPLEDERYEGLDMDARMTVCSWNTNVIMVWAWMLW